MALPIPRASRIICIGWQSFAEQFLAVSAVFDAIYAKIDQLKMKHARELSTWHSCKDWGLQLPEILALPIASIQVISYTVISTVLILRREDTY